MTYTEIYGDLFELTKDHILAHCISADFALGAGIAKQFADKGVKDTLFARYKHSKADEWDNHGYCIITHTYSHQSNSVFRRAFVSEIPLTVANLVTKQRCFQKPTLKSLAEALIDFRDKLNKNKFPVKIAMPCIGCGIDRLQWEDVSELIKQVFADTPYDITICKLKSADEIST